MTTIDEAYTALLTACEDSIHTQRDDVVWSLAGILNSLSHTDRMTLLGVVSFDLVTMLHAVNMSVPEFLGNKKAARG